MSYPHDSRSDSCSIEPESILAPASRFVPPTFSGKKDESVVHWIYLVSLALGDRPDIDSEKERIMFATRYLRGLALQWFMEHVRGLHFDDSSTTPCNPLDPDSPNHYKHRRFGHPMWWASYDKFVIALRAAYPSDPFGPVARSEAMFAGWRAENDEHERRRGIEQAEQWRICLWVLAIIVGVILGVRFGWPSVKDAVGKSDGWRGAVDQGSKFVQERAQVNDKPNVEL